MAGWFIGLPSSEGDRCGTKNGRDPERRSRGITRVGHLIALGKTFGDRRRICPLSLLAFFASFHVYSFFVPSSLSIAQVNQAHYTMLVLDSCDTNCDSVSLPAKIEIRVIEPDQTPTY